MIMSVRIRWCASAVVLVLVACLAGGGCDSQSKERDAQKRQNRLDRQARRERERARDTTAPDQVIGRRDRSTRGLDEVPTTATRVDEGSGPLLSYAPSRDGTLYIYDTDDDRVVFSTPARQDDRFVLDPDANRATLNGRTVLGTGLVPSHRYRIYFDRGRADLSR
jgi:hypothetical protein